MSSANLPAPHFNAQHLPATRNEYVAWLDVQGIRSTMSRSLAISANFVMRLHTSAIQARAASGNVRLYPVMDGVYVTSERKAHLCQFLRSVMQAVATDFVTQETPHHRYVVKGAIAFGPVVHGAQIPHLASHTIHATPDYAACLLLGMPMIQAFESESQAPAFGFFVHESARAFCPQGDQPFRYSWWRWFLDASGNLSPGLPAALTAHFQWCLGHSHEIGYTADRVTFHRHVAEQYFGAPADGP